MRLIKGISFLLLLSLSISLIAQNSGKMTGEDYVETYKDLAIKEMVRTGIPASITLAQGMLESDYGNSRLAVNANNHFGIKCHDDWSGKKIYHDDDERRECFRRYKTVYESYEDHSDFLKSGLRYSFLFELDPIDYKAWAKGLKQAGYATNPEYADKLIRIIEDNSLHQYDIISLKAEKQKEVRKVSRTKPSGQRQPSRAIFERNRIDYIIVKEGDTYERLQKELGLLPFEIYKYNDLSRDSLLFAGREIYIQPKRAKAVRGSTYHIVKQGETMYIISQKYGVKLDRLYKMNIMKEGTEPVTDQKISLRKKLKGDIKPEENNKSGKGKRIKNDQKPEEVKAVKKEDIRPEKEKIRKERKKPEPERIKPLKEKINPEKDEEKIQFEFK